MQSNEFCLNEIGCALKIPKKVVECKKDDALIEAYLLFPVHILGKYLCLVVLLCE
jgi:hypothetical protein